MNQLKQSAHVIAYSLIIAMSMTPVCFAGKATQRSKNINLEIISNNLNVESIGVDLLFYEEKVDSRVKTLVSTYNEDPLSVNVNQLEGDRLFAHDALEIADAITEYMQSNTKPFTKNFCVNPNANFTLFIYILE